MSEYILKMLEAAGPVLLSLAGAMLLLAARVAIRSLTRILENNKREHEALYEKLYQFDVRIAGVELRFEDNIQEHHAFTEQLTHSQRLLTNHGERLTKIETTCELSRPALVPEKS